MSKDLSRLQGSCHPFIIRNSLFDILRFSCTRFLLSELYKNERFLIMRRGTFLLIVALLGIGLGVWWATHPALLAEPDTDIPRYPSETGWLKRTFPHFQADADAYQQAHRHAQALRATFKSDAFGAWTFAGPTNIGGRIVDVAFDPGTPTTIYAAAATGGVFKSTDAGQTWIPIFDDQPLLTIGDMAVDPSDPQTLYVGTGEANGGHNNFAGSGVYKSTDGGQTWSSLGLAETTSIGRILVDPVNPQRVYVAAAGSYFAPNPERGLYRSDDGGQTWDHILFTGETTGVIDLVMRPDDPDVLLAATWERLRTPTEARLAGPGSGIYKSTDGGDTWTRLGASNGLPSGPAGRIGLALCRDVPDAVYALYTDGSTYQDFYRSDDGGLTWTDADPSGKLGDGFADFSWYFGQVRVHPKDPNRVFVLDLEINRSTDGGHTWTRATGTHVDHHALAFHPIDPSFIIEGNDGGLALSNDDGQTWTKVAELPVTQFYEIAIDPTDPTILYGGTQDNGTLRSHADGWRQILGGDGFYVLIDPTNPTILYAESQNGGLVKIVNGQVFPATSGIAPGDKRNWSTPVVMDPINPQVLYYGTQRIWRTENGAASWAPISPDLTKNLGHSLLGTVTTIAIAPSDPRVIYAGTDDGNVWVTSDRGANWANITTSTLPFRWITRFVVDPYDADTAYLTYSGIKWRDPQPHVFRTTDRGATWHDLSANLPDAPVNAFAVDPSNTAYLYLGNDIGAFVSTDGGARWGPLGTDLPAVSVYDLKIYDDETQRFLVAGTHGRSMYTLDLSSVPAQPPDHPTATDDTPVLSDVVAFDPAYPNPFITQTTLTYRLDTPAHVRLEVYDVAGRRLATLTDARMTPGTHTATWAPVATAAGLYLARLTATTTDGTISRTALLTRVRY